MGVLSKFVRRSGDDRCCLRNFKATGGAMSDRILNLAQLEALYDEPSRNSLVKVARHITPEYGAWIGAARFCVSSTVALMAPMAARAGMRIQLCISKIRRPSLCPIGAAITGWIPCAISSKMAGCLSCSWCPEIRMWYASMAMRIFRCRRRILQGLSAMASTHAAWS